MRLFLPVAPDLDDPVRPLDLGERDVGPAEAVAGRLHAKARARAAPDRVDPREMPVDQVVVGELGVVGDVLQVVEDLLAGGGDDDRHGHGVHGERESSRRRRSAARALRLRARRLTRRGRSGARCGRARQWRDDLAGDRRLAAHGRHSSQTMPPLRPA